MVVPRSRDRWTYWDPLRALNPIVVAIIIVIFAVVVVVRSVGPELAKEALFGKTRIAS